MRAWMALIVALAWSATVSPARTEDLTTRDGRPIRTVAVLSRLGDQITLYYAHRSVPITVWAGKTRDFVIPEFGIDARIERAIAAAISPRFNVAALGPGTATVGVLFNEDNMREAIAKMPPRPDIDAYIVVCHDESSVEMGALLTTHGLVLYHRSKLFGHLTGLLGFYRVMIVDARTGDTIADQVGGIETDIFHPSTARKEIDNSFWPGEEAVPSVEQVPALREELYKFVDESIAWTLKRMELMP